MTSTKKANGKYRLIDAIKPDIFAAVEDSYPPEQIEEIRKYCGDVVVLPRQAEETSTSNFIQNTIKKYLAKIHNIAEEL